MTKPNNGHSEDKYKQMKKVHKTKELILEVSSGLFSEFGFEGTSIRNIAKKVGVRESAIYNHFESKQSIFLELMNNLKPESISKEILTDELIDQLNRPEKFLVNFAQNIYRFWQSRNERLFIKLLLKEQPIEIGGIQFSVKNYVEEYIKIIALIFNELMKHKFIKRGNSGIYANLFFAPIFLLRITNLEAQNQNDIYSSIKEHVKYFWETIQPK